MVSDYTRDIYRDTGCEVASKCIECPLPVCRYEARAQPDLRVERDRTIWALRQLGVRRQVIADKFGISLSTVDAAIKHRGEPPAPRKPLRPEPQPIYKARQPWPRLQVAQ